MLSRNGKNNSNGEFDWRDSVIDAAILGGLAGLAAAGSAQFVMNNPVLSFVTGLLAFTTDFLIVLAVKRGLREKDNRVPS